MSKMMDTFPPAPEAQVSLANWRNAPFNAWAFHHVREIVPSAEIANDPANAQTLPVGESLQMPGCTYDGQAVDFEGFCEQSATDALLILHKGRIIHEHYTNGMTARDPHILMSLSKSMLGLLYGILADKGIVDISAPASTYVPELEQTAFRGATVRDLLDMRTGVHFIEDYLATEGPIVEYRKSTNWNPLEPGQAPTDLRSFLLTLTESRGPHGGTFDYISVCTDLLGWIVERAMKRRYVDVFAELLWKPSGAADAGYITVDRLGAPRCAGGKCLTARSLAQIGQLVAEGGRGIVPAEWIEDLWTAGDTDAWDNGSMAEYFPGISMHYRSKWYCVRSDRPVLMGLGVHGQHLMIDRAAELVLVKFGSAAAPLETTNDLGTLSLFEAVRDAVG